MQQGRRGKGDHGDPSQEKGWCVREGSRLRRVQRLALWRRSREGSAACGPPSEHLAGQQGVGTTPLTRSLSPYLCQGVGVHYMSASLCKGGQQDPPQFTDEETEARRLILAQSIHKCVSALQAEVPEKERAVSSVTCGRHGDCPTKCFVYILMFFLDWGFPREKPSDMDL